MTKKINEIRRSAKFAWSPTHHGLMATCTMTGTLDESFSSASQLELFQLEQTESLKVNTTSRLNTIGWGNSLKEYGLIAGGMETGDLELWDPSCILDNKSEVDCLVMRNSTHSGTLQALDFNLIQTNLLASAGSNSEVYIWDLYQPNTPYTPGSKSSKMNEITSVAWNCQVQHIVSTASTNGFTVIWDLRNKKEVMTLAYQGTERGSISSIAWHPDIATQIVTASKDDMNPIISLWDLRHAQSPEKVLKGHSKGVLDISWCKQDSDLLLSSGKDGKTLCWNPNTSLLFGEIDTSHQWTYQVNWCPSYPDLLASASYDGCINVFSITNTPSDNTLSFKLPQAPKWLRRPIGASFGFSGKLVTFNNKKAEKVISAATVSGTKPNLKQISRPVEIRIIETDPEIIKRSEQLESATENNILTLIEDRLNSGKDKKDWQILQTLFSDNARERLMQYLGFEKNQIMEIANNLLNNKNEQQEQSIIINDNEKKFNLFSGTEIDGFITNALVLGDFDNAVNICLNTERFSDAFMIAMCGDEQLLIRTQKAYFEKKSSKSYLRLLKGIVNDDLFDIVNNADLKDWSSILVVLCTFASSENFASLCDIVANRLLKQESQNAILFYLISGNLEKVTNIWISQFDEQKEEDYGIQLQALVEKITIFRKAIDYEDCYLKNNNIYILEKLYEKYCEYAEFMVSQGQLEVALKYINLTPTNYAKLINGSVIRDRIIHATPIIEEFIPQPSITATLCPPKRYQNNTFIASNTASIAAVDNNRPVRGLNGPPSSNTTLGYYSAHQHQIRNTPPMRQTKNK